MEWFKIEISKNPPMIAITICPAVKLAPNRNARIKGRTMILTVSIMIKKGLRLDGAPEGSKDATTFWPLFLIPEMMKSSQNGNLKDSVIARWLVSPKT